MNEIPTEKALENSLNQLMTRLDLFRNWRKATTSGGSYWSEDETMIIEILTLCEDISMKGLCALTGKSISQISKAVMNLENGDWVKVSKEQDGGHSRISLGFVAPRDLEESRKQHTYSAGLIFISSRSLEAATPLHDEAANVLSAIRTVLAFQEKVCKREMFSPTVGGVK